MNTENKTKRQLYYSRLSPEEKQRQEEVRKVREANRTPEQRELDRIGDRIRSRKHSRSHKERCMEYKGNKCQHCGCTGIPDIFDFHHTDPDKKEYSLSKLKSLQGGLTDKTKTELDKCLMLCSNCHRTEHARIAAEREAQELKWLSEKSPVPIEDQIQKIEEKFQYLSRLRMSINGQPIGKFPQEG